MFDLEVLLVAICHLAKDVHYKSKGENFWGDHLLADKIHDDLDDFIDEINESGFLGHQNDAPNQEEVLMAAAELLKPESKDFAGIDNLIVKALTEIEMLKDGADISTGDSDLLGRIGNDLQSKHGLLWRRIL